MTSQFVKRTTGPAVVEAARYQYGHGRAFTDVRAVALRGSHAAQLVEVDAWRVLLVRTGPPDDDPFYEVVADGTWLVYDPATGNLAAWDDDEFAEAYGPPPEPGLVEAVASAIGQHMVLRESTKQIATAALFAAGYQEAGRG
jgi:hypothetical protein